MSHTPKLEIFTLRLNPKRGRAKTFRQFLSETLYPQLTAEQTNAKPESEIFLDYFAEFIDAYDGVDFIADHKKKKAFGAYDSRPQGNHPPSIHPHSQQYIIDGHFEGGKFGQRRNRSSLGNKAQKEGLDERTVILDRFYFLIYTPFPGDIGVIIIQGYSSDSIADVVCNNLSGFFGSHADYNKATITRFIPRALIEEFKGGSFIRSFSYMQKVPSGFIDGNEIAEVDDEFTIRIQATSKNGISSQEMPNWLRALRRIVFKGVPLNDFQKESVVLENENSGNKYSFNIDENSEIRPVKYLEDLRLDADGNPNLVELQNYCFAYLEQIKLEVYPENEV